MTTDQSLEISGMGMMDIEKKASLKNKLLDGGDDNYNQFDSFGGLQNTPSVDGMLLEQIGQAIGDIGRRLGLNEEALHAMQKNPAVQHQLINIFSSLQKDVISSSKVVTSESIAMENGHANDIAQSQTEMVLGPSMRLPQDKSLRNSVSPEYAMSTNVPCSPTSSEEMGPIALPGTYMTIMEEETLTDCEDDEGKKIDMTFAHEELEQSAEHSDNCDDTEDALNWQFDCELVNFCNKINSPDYICDESENINLQYSPKSGQIFNELSDVAEYAVPSNVSDESFDDDPFNTAVSPVLPDHPPVSVTEVLENISVHPYSEDIFMPGEDNLKQPSLEWNKSKIVEDVDMMCSPTSTICEDTCFEQEINHIGLDDVDFIRTFLNEESRFPDNQLAEVIYPAEPSPVHDPDDYVNYPIDKPPSVESQSYPNSPCSVISSSSRGSDAFEQSDDALPGLRSRSPCIEVVDDDDAVYPLRKKRKVENPHDAVKLEPCIDDAKNGFSKFNSAECKNEIAVDESNVVFRVDDDGDLVLHVAVLQGDEEGVKLCLELMNGQKVDAKNDQQQTALHIACYTGNVKSIWDLLQAGADPEEVDSDGNNMMHLGCMMASTEFMELLGQHYANQPHKLNAMLEKLNYEGRSPLHELVKMRNEVVDEEMKAKSLDVANYLLQKFNCGLDVKELKAGSTVLISAIEKRDWELVELFITCGANINLPTYSGLFPLDFVAHSDNLELAKDLINRGGESGVKIDFTNDEMKAIFDNDKRKRRRGKKRPAKGAQRSE